MHLKINNFTGFEKECEILVLNIKGEYQKTFYLTNLELKLFKNIQNNYDVKIISYECIEYVDSEEGVKYNFKNHEIILIQTAIKEMIDWEEWEESNHYDDSDFIENHYY
jgi:hypothetical protein